MAKARISDLENLVELSQPPASETYATEEIPSFQEGFPGLIQLENKTSVELDVTLTDGTNVRMWPRQKGSTNHVSRPFLRKLLPTYINKLVSKGDVKIINK